MEIRSLLDFGYKLEREHVIIDKEVLKLVI